MTELLTAAQMRAIEKAAIDSGQVTGLGLMERAGRGVVDAIFAEWPELAKYPHKAVVLCGPGNNGGDGFVVARLLKDWGWEVDVFLYGDPEQLPPDARVNFELWSNANVVAPLDEFDRRLYNYDVAIDALFGIGLSRPTSGPLSHACNTFKVLSTPDLCRRVALDLPSGLCSDSGRVLGVAAVVDLTVTFHRMKLGHVIADGPGLCGVVRVVDIGVDDTPRVSVREGRAGLVAPPFHRLLKGMPFRKFDDPGRHNKFSHGHALVLSGPMGRSGAARLAARAALRVGAGLVTVGAPGSAMMECACQLTAIMLRKTEDPEALATALEDTRINAICIGPGLGLDRARDLVPIALAAARRTVLDADALTAYTDDPAALFAMLHPGVVLSPHGGEFARLFPDLSEKLVERTGKDQWPRIFQNRRDAWRRRRDAGCDGSVQGRQTQSLPRPDGSVAAIHSAAYERAAPWLATAGSGDVLSGIIAPDC